MNAAENKQLVQRIFSELSKGNTRPFVESWADDFCWTVIGTTKWSKTYRGKQAVLDELMGPLFAQFAGRYTLTAQLFIAEGDYVVVECRGQVTTKSGRPYNNTYCYVIRLADGKLRELTDYLDTALVESALETLSHNRSMPPGAVIPVLAYADVMDAVAWLCGAFGFKERLRIGSHRVQLSVGSGSVVVVGGLTASAPDTAKERHATQSVMVRVEDVEDHCRRAKAHGARVTQAPADYPYGERQYSVEDLAGHAWTFSQTVADIHPADWGGTLFVGGGDAV